MGVQGGRQQGGDWGLGGGRGGVGGGLMFVVVVKVVVVVVDRRAVVGNDRRGGWEDVGGQGWSRRGWVAPRHAGVGRGSSSGHGGGGGAREALGQWLIVEEVCALLDEALDDCLVGAGSRQGVHGGEVWSHQRGPETDGQVLTGH